MGLLLTLPSCSTTLSLALMLQVSTDLHAELRSLLSDMDELDMMGMDDEMAEDASSYLAAAPKPQQQTKQQLLQLQQQAARPSTSKAVVAGLPRTASAPQPPAAAAAAAPLQIAPARPERIQLQSEHEEPQQPLAQSQTSNVRAERTEPEASPAAAQSLPAASAEAEPRAHAGAQQAASPAPTGTAAVTDEWDVFWDGPQATPGTPAPAPAAADVQPTQRPAFAADWAPLAFGESPANMGPATRDDNHEVRHPVAENLTSHRSCNCQCDWHAFSAALLVVSSNCGLALHELRR